MRSRIFTPSQNTELATTALKLRNDATPFGMGALVASVFAASPALLTAAVHSSGKVEIYPGVELTDAPFDAFSIENASLSESHFDGGEYEASVVLGIGDNRSKTLAVNGTAYAVTTTHANPDLQINAIANILAKPVSPNYTVLSAINDIADALDEILSDDNATFSKWSIFVNQKDTSIVVLLHNGFDGTSDTVAGTSFENDWEGVIETFVGVIPTAGGPDVVRQGWE